MLALYQIGWVGSHVITKIIETELVVGTEGDICQVCLATLVGIRTVLVDTIYRETVEHIERSHPLRVTLSQIVVHGNDVNTITSQGIQEDRCCTYKGLTFTGSHLGNLTLMENKTTEELYIVVNHFPFHIITAGCPVVVIDSLVAIDGNEVVSWIRSQLAVEVGISNYCFLVLSETASSILNDSENLRQNLVEGYLILVKCFLL